jgi:hypothetical protein
MSAATKVGAAIVSVALIAGAIATFESKGDKEGHDPDDRKVILVASTDKGHGYVQYNAGKGMRHDEFGSSWRDKKSQPGEWSHTEWVKPGTQIVLIVTADEVTGAHCAIRALGIPARPPGVSPSDTTNTVECTGMVK